MRLSRFVPEGGLIPRFYGVAYRTFERCGSICYPVPLNLVVRRWRELWASLSVPFGKSHDESYAYFRSEIEKLNRGMAHVMGENEALRKYNDELIQKARAYDLMMAKLAELEAGLDKRRGGIS